MAGVVAAATVAASALSAARMGPRRVLAAPLVILDVLLFTVLYCIVSLRQEFRGQGQGWGPNVLVLMTDLPTVRREHVGHHHIMEVADMPKEPAAHRQ